MPDRTQDRARPGLDVAQAVRAARAFEFGRELGGPAPGALGAGALVDGVEEARRFEEFVRRRRQAPVP